MLPPESVVPLIIRRTWTLDKRPPDQETTLKLIKHETRMVITYGTQGFDSPPQPGAPILRRDSPYPARLLMQYLTKVLTYGTYGTGLQYHLWY